MVAVAVAVAVAVGVVVGVVVAVGVAVAVAVVVAVAVSVAVGVAVVWRSRMNAAQLRDVKNKIIIWVAVLSLSLLQGVFWASLLHDERWWLLRNMLCLGGGFIVGLIGTGAFARNKKLMEKL